MGILFIFPYLILFLKSLAAQSPILYPIKSSDIILNCLSKALFVELGRWTLQVPRITWVHSVRVLLGKKPATEPGSLQLEPLDRGEAGRWGCPTSHTFALLAPQSPVLLPAIASLLIQSPEPWACCAVGNWEWVQATLSWFRRGVAKSLTLLSPTAQLRISGCCGDLATVFWAFLQLCAQLGSKLLHFAWFSTSWPSITCSREFIGIITIPFPCESK